MGSSQETLSISLALDSPDASSSSQPTHTWSAGCLAAVGAELRAQNGAAGGGLSYSVAEDRPLLFRRTHKYAQ